MEKAKILPIKKRYILKQIERNNPNSFVIFDTEIDNIFDIRTRENKNLMISLLNDYDSVMNYAEDIEFKDVKKRGRPSKKLIENKTGEK